MTATHPDLLALVDACRADREDRTRQLALADWYEEHATSRVPCGHERCKNGNYYTGMDGMKWVPCGLCQKGNDFALRAEMVRLQVELEARPYRRNSDSTAFVWDTCPRCGHYRCKESDACGICTMWAKIIANFRDLAARLHPAWPCPVCRTEIRPSDPDCQMCGGSSDLLTANLPTYVGGSDPRHEPRPLTFHAGWPDVLTVPTMGELVREVTVHPGFVDLRPTPRLAALAGPTPWGVPLWGVYPQDREPDYDRKDRRPVWFNRDQDSAGGPAIIPAPVYDAMTGYDDVPCPSYIGKWYPTPDAAKLALARALLKFGKGN